MRRRARGDKTEDLHPRNQRFWTRAEFGRIWLFLQVGRVYRGVTDEWPVILALLSDEVGFVPFQMSSDCLANKAAV